MNIVLKSGFLLINKPCGITSYGCIGYLKRIIRQKIKIGHAGTLDPFASGLLIVAIGSNDVSFSMLHNLTLLFKSPISIYFSSGEMTASIMISHHNLAFFLETMRRVRESIRSGKFSAFRSSFLEGLRNNEALGV